MCDWKDGYENKFDYDVWYSWEIDSDSNDNKEYKLVIKLQVLPIIEN